MIKSILEQLITVVFKHYKEHILVIVITLTSLIIMFFEPVSSEWLRYQSAEVNQGQWWRILTANLCHSNWNHWALNISGLWLMDLFYQPVMSAKLRANLLLFCMLLNVTLLHFLLDIGWYVGLSGALHGYLIGGALLSWNNQKVKLSNLLIIAATTTKMLYHKHWQLSLQGYLVFGILLFWGGEKLVNLGIILVTTGKLIAESLWQINSATEVLIGANVLEESHSFGALSSVLFFMIWFIFGKIKKPLKE